MSKEPRRLFTTEQKAEAVRIVEQSDKPVSQIAKEMGLSSSALHSWIRQSNKSEPNGPLTSSERKELMALRRELKRVEMEQDFLKKAATFFARETGDPMN